MRKTRVHIPAGLNMLILSGVFIAAAILTPSTVLAAACAAPTSDYGSVTSTVNIPGPGTYRIWSRIQAPSTTNNTYLLEIDGNTCFNVGGNTAMPLNSWQWINYQNGNTSSYTSMALTAGTHTVKMIGNKPDVLLDRVVFTLDLTCTPDNPTPVVGGYQPGDNCASPDDTNGPTVNITAPAPGVTVGGNAVPISATATDTNSVDKVEFYVGTTLLYTDNTDNKSLYTYNWNTASGYTNGNNYTIKIVATDKSSNANKTEKTVTVKVDNTVPLGPGDVGDDGSGTVGFEDLLAVLNNWNLTGRTRRQGDLANNDGKVDFDDLLEVLNNWTK